jgi:hypothetical protein
VQSKTKQNNDLKQKHSDLSNVAIQLISLALSSSHVIDQNASVLGHYFVLSLVWSQNYQKIDSVHCSIQSCHVREGME